MGYPKHVNPIEKRRDARGNRYWATAPYNFVPLPDKVVAVEQDRIPTHDVYADGAFSGYLDVTLTTKTPLYVRSMITQELFEKVGDVGIGDLLSEIEKLERANESHKHDAKIAELERIVRERAQFFTIRDTERPIIPGSSLRGMLRALVEIVGYGKVQSVNNEILIFRAIGDRTPLGNFYRDLVMGLGKRVQVRLKDKDKTVLQFEPQMQAGFVRGKGHDWEIQPAKMVNGTTFARIARKIPPPQEKFSKHGKPEKPEEQKFPFVEWNNPENLRQAATAHLHLDEETNLKLKPYGKTRNAFEIWVQVGAYDYHLVQGRLKIKSCYVTDARAVKTDGYERAVVAFSGEIDKKRHEAVIFMPDENVASEILDDRLVEAYREQISPEQKNLLGEGGALQQEQPVFYRKLGKDVAFFGHTMMLRMAYGRSARDYVPTALRDPNVTDLAEAIFGWVARDADDKRAARASRVFVTDARCEKRGDEVWLQGEPFSPRILASPKITTFQHYLAQLIPDDQIVSYTKDGKPQYQANLSHYGSKTPEETVIRGHKMYWHRGQVDADKIAGQKQNGPNTSLTQYTRFKPVRAGIPFSFRIYFENLTDVEMGALLWVLNLPAEHYAKLGMGKPLGMGAVELKATPVVHERKSRYEKLVEGDDWFQGNADAKFDADKCCRAFNDFILTRMDPAERGGAKQIEELERIRALLEMLKWRDDSPMLEYMELKRFRHRPVLPDPFGIQEPNDAAAARAQGQAKSSHRAAGAPRENKSARSKPPIEIPEPEPETPPVTPKQKEYLVGIIFTGTVREIEEDGAVIVELPGRDYAKHYAIIEAADLAGKQFRAGNPARCEILDIAPLKDKATVYMCKPAPPKKK